MSNDELMDRANAEILALLTVPNPKEETQDLIAEMADTIKALSQSQSEVCPYDLGVADGYASAMQERDLTEANTGSQSQVDVETEIGKCPHHGQDCVEPMCSETGMCIWRDMDKNPEEYTGMPQSTPIPLDEIPEEWKVNEKPFLVAGGELTFSGGQTRKYSGWQFVWLDSEVGDFVVVNGCEGNGQYVENPILAMLPPTIPTDTSAKGGTNRSSK